MNAPSKVLGTARFSPLPDRYLQFERTRHNRLRRGLPLSRWLTSGKNRVFLRRPHPERSQDLRFRFISGWQTFFNSADRQKGYSGLSRQL